MEGSSWRNLTPGTPHRKIPGTFLLWVNSANHSITTSPYFRSVCVKPPSHKTPTHLCFLYAPYMITTMLFYYFTVSSFPHEPSKTNRYLSLWVGQMPPLSKDKSSIISYIFCVFAITSEKVSNFRLKELHLWYFSVVKCQNGSNPTWYIKYQFVRAKTVESDVVFLVY